MGNGGRLGKIAKWEMGRHKLRKRCLTVMGEKIGENGELMTDIHQVMYYVVIIWNSGRLGKIAKNGETYTLIKRCLTVVSEDEEIRRAYDRHKWVVYYVVIIWNGGRLGKIANEEMEKHIPNSGTDYLTKLNQIKPLSSV